MDSEPLSDFCKYVQHMLNRHRPMGYLRGDAQCVFVSDACAQFPSFGIQIGKSNLEHWTLLNESLHSFPLYIVSELHIVMCNQYNVSFEY